jgi:hypothetical protein
MRTTLYCSVVPKTACAVYWLGFGLPYDISLGDEEATMNQSNETMLQLYFFLGSVGENEVLGRSMHRRPQSG